VVEILQKMILNLTISGFEGLGFAGRTPFGFMGG